MIDKHAPLSRLLPHAYPFVLIDRVVELEAGKKIVCIKNVSINEKFFQGRFAGNPVFPEVYIIEAMAQTSGLLIADEKTGAAYLSMIKDAEFYRTVKPGEQLVITSSLSYSLDPLFMFAVKVSVEGEVVSEAEITISLM